jgi:hypothetical protein
MVVPIFLYGSEIQVVIKVTAEFKQQKFKFLCLI